MSSWPQHPLESLLAEPLRNGRSVRTSAGGFPVLRLTAMKNGSVDLRERKPGAWSRAEALPFLVRYGDYMITRGNGTLDLVGRGALVRSEPDEVAFPDTMIRARPDTERLDRDYLGYAWNAPMVRKQVEATARTSAGIFKVNQVGLGQVLLPVPPLAEQRRVVDLLEEHLASLDAADRYLTSASKRVDGLWAALLESNFGAALSARVPLASYVSSIFAGKSLGASTPPARLDEWGIIKVSAMTRGDFRETENKAVPTDRIDPRHEIHAGDLLVSRANTADYVGASVLVPQGVRPRLLLSDKSLRIVPAEGVRVEWLWRALQTPSARQQISQLATGTKDSMRNISQPSLLRVLVPNADPAEQVAAVASFAEHAECVERQSQALRSAQSRASDLRRALLSAAFSGRLTGRSSDCQLIEELADQEAS